MSLFPQEQTADGTTIGNAPGRMAMTRERGTRRLLAFVLLVFAGWFIIGKIQDHFLLSKVWPTLPPNEKGLTVVGTLDSRSSYERNMFIIIQSNKTSRVALTGSGWQTIFSGTEGELFDENVGNILRYALDVDSQKGYVMLEPFLRVGIKRTLNQPVGPDEVSEATPLTVHEIRGTKETVTQTTLGTLLKEFSGGRASDRESGDSDGNSSGSGRTVDDERITIPGENLIRVCPVVLTAAHFTNAWWEEHPATLLQGKTYTVHLELTPEGRSRFYQWSRDHANENLVFVNEGRVLTAGRIRQTMDVNSWEIRPVRDQEAAQELIDAVKKR